VWNKCGQAGIFVNNFINSQRLVARVFFSILVLGPLKAVPLKLNPHPHEFNPEAAVEAIKLPQRPKNINLQ